MELQNRRTIENEAKRIYKNCTKDMEDNNEWYIILEVGITKEIAQTQKK